MREIKTASYGPLALELIQKAAAEKRPTTLAFGSPAPDALASLRGMTDQNLSQNRRVRMPQDAEALRAGLWLLFDYMTESHDISQKIGTPSGSYWHGILHRREPDAANAKYWMERVGEHPISGELFADAREIAETSGAKELIAELAAMKSWNAAWFVERCTGYCDAEATSALLEIQRREWTLLFDYNFQKAFA